MARLLKNAAGLVRTQTAYEYGKRAEDNARNSLRNIGYRVIRAAASQGIFDLVGFHESGRDVVAVQVKRGEKPSPCEYKGAVELPVAPGVIKLVVWYPQGMGAARVLYCADQGGEVPLPEWCGTIRWLAGPLPKQHTLRGI
jgi:hypothetical protein